MRYDEAHIEKLRQNQKVASQASIIAANAKAKDRMLGAQYESLTVIGRDPGSRAVKAKLICRCSCGAITKIQVGVWGKTRSCYPCSNKMRAEHNRKRNAIYNRPRSYAATWSGAVDRDFDE